MRQIATADDLEAIIGRPSPLVLGKQLDMLDAGSTRIIAASPLAGFGFRDASGLPHTTYVSGVRVSSSRRISLETTDGPPPAGSGVSFVFFLPGTGETLRLNGRVAESGPKVSVHVEEVYVHCARCIIRSRLWDPPRGAQAATSVAGFLARSPFLVVSTWDASGSSDTSPRGDLPGFVRVLADGTLAIPDRKGNQRADTFRNLLENDTVALAAVIPGRMDILHLRGRGRMTDDAALLAGMALNGKPPHGALLIDVEHAEVTANPALTTSRVWDPAAHLARDAVPDLMMLAGEHLAANRGGAARLLAAFPRRLFRTLIDLAYRRQLKAEGFAKRQAARQVRVAEVIRETANAVTLILQDPTATPFTFRAGQFFTLVTEIDGVTVRRAYSASSAPGSDRLAVTVKRLPGGLVSGHVNDRVRVGDRLQVLGPSGNFFVEPSPDLVLLAAGSGITPMMSIIRTTLADPAGGRIRLLYGNRSAADIIFADALAELQTAHADRLAVRHVLSSQAGRIDAAAIRPLVTSPAHYYICGPEPMMRACHDALADLGVTSERVHAERFVSSRPASPTPTAPQPLTITRGGARVGSLTVGSGRTLLDAGLAAGLPMDFSCTVGTCGECVVRLVRGDVETAEPNCLTPDERARGSILTCVSRPLSPVAIDLDTEDR